MHKPILVLVYALVTGNRKMFAQQQLTLTRNPDWCTTCEKLNN